MSDKLKDNLTNFHDNDIFIPRRTVSMIGGVDLSMFDTVFKNLHALDITTGDINLIINSEGGDVVQGKGIYQALRGCESTVKGIVYSEASSAASFVLQGCDVRIMTPESYLMLHIGQEELSENHPRNIDRLHEFYRNMETWLEDVYLKRIKEKRKRFTRSQIKSMLQYDRYIYPKEALDLGLIDEIKECL